MHILSLKTECSLSAVTSNPCSGYESSLCGQKMTKEPGNFDELLLDSIDDAFLSLGEPVKKSIYYNIEQHFHVTRKDIPQKLPQFQEGLERIFGLGARFLEILIMKNLYAKTGCPLNVGQKKQLEFIKYVEAARQSFTKGCGDA